MNYDNFSKVANNQERDLEMSRAFPALMRKVYTRMPMKTFNERDSFINR